MSDCLLLSLSKKKKNTLQMTSPVTAQWMGALHNYVTTTTVHVPNWHCLVYRGGVGDNNMLCE